MRQLFAAVFALSFCATSAAQISLGAQYQWFDQNGQMVFSDKPPPASVPLSRILRVGDPPAVQSAPNAPGAGASDKVAVIPAQTRAPRKSSRPSISEQMLAFEKRRAKRKLDRKKGATQAKQAKATARSCERMQTSKAQLESGRRLRTRSKDGVLAPMTGAERSKQSKALAKQLKKCRS